jgi:heat shock protein HslJ
MSKYDQAGQVRMSRWALWPALALSVLTGCVSQPVKAPSTEKTATDAGLSRWELVRWQDSAGGERALPTGEPVFLLFSDGIDAKQGSVTGNTGCNQVRGGYAATASGMRFTQLVSTRRACEPARMAVESGIQAAFASPLERVASQPSEAAPGGRQIVWKTSAGELLQFQEREPVRQR